MGIYECQNAGCLGNGSIVLSEGEEKFYADKGLSQPRSCRECRTWKKAQYDSQITCEACASVRRISKRAKIWYHKNVGSWEDPVLCKACEADPDRATTKRGYRRSMMTLQAVRNRLHRLQYEPQLEELNRIFQEYPEHRSDIDIRTGTFISQPETYEILDNAEVYKQIVEHREPGERKSTAYDHITKHQHKSGKLLGTNDGQQLLNWSRDIVQQTDPKKVTEFRDVTHTPPRIIKQDNQTGQVVILKNSEIPPPRLRVLTTFKPDKIDYVSGKIINGYWIVKKKEK